MSIPRNIFIALIIILIISISLNVYQLTNSKIDTKGYYERIEMQNTIDSLKNEYKKIGTQLERQIILIDSLQAFKKDPEIIIEKSKYEIDKKYKIYKSLTADERVREWRTLSRK